MLALAHFAVSDRGRVRANNEDAVGSFVPAEPKQLAQRGCLFVLADGVGGQRQGEIAARWAVEGLVAGFQHAPPQASQRNVLERLIAEINARIFSGNLEAGPGGMATTLVACALHRDRATVAHVGDSRCYLYRQGRLRRLTEDHNLAAEQARLGLIPAQAGAASPNSSLLTRSLGTGMTVRAEIAVHQLQAGDRLLLSSDGLHAYVEPDQIAAALGGPADPPAAAQRLIALANGNGGGDNVTALVVHIHQVEATGMYRGRTYALR